MHKGCVNLYNTFFTLHNYIQVINIKTAYITLSHKTEGTQSTEPGTCITLCAPLTSYHHHILICTKTQEPVAHQSKVNILECKFTVALHDLVGIITE
jgi:hypothetical protein